MKNIVLHFSLVGKVREIKVGKERTNADLANGIKKVIQQQFGDRPILFMSEDIILSDERYPSYYIAGWFTGDNKELVVIDHGNSMKSARQSLFASINNIDWDSCAKEF